VTESLTGGFSDAQELTEALRGQDYVVEPDLAVVALLAIKLDRPLLLEGPAGVGKTELAKSLAGASGRRLLRLQCYEGIDEGQALYEWDYGKQLMHVQMLRDRISDLLADTPDLAQAAKLLREQDTGLYTEHFLATRPLMEAVRSEQPTVLLVDEVDRSDEALEALLLEVLAEKQVTVPEIGTFAARSAPWVVLTSNDTRELTPALKRRCLHFHLDFPDIGRECEIVARRAPEVAEGTVREVVELAGRLRTMTLRKPPSISEVVDAARAAAEVDEVSATHPSLLSTLVKYDTDAEMVRAEFGTKEEPDEQVDGRERTGSVPGATFSGHGGRLQGRSGGSVR
jgi:MoxR-like ATPase